MRKELLHVMLELHNVKIEPSNVRKKVREPPNVRKKYRTTKYEKTVTCDVGSA